MYVFVAGAGAVVALAAGCSSSTKNSVAPPPSATSSAPSVTGVALTVKTANSTYGQILTDGSGHTLYLFKADTGTTPTCTGSCAALWPGATTNGTPQAFGFSGAMLGTTMRTDDHKTQVTIDGHPLYYFSHDTKAGDVNGQGYAGVWYVVSPSGAAITSMHPSGTTAPSTPAPTTPHTMPPTTSPSPSSGGGSGGGYGY
jgi:predicted lipoprotein with Yx(FWY)xxD motif